MTFIFNHIQGNFMHKLSSRTQHTNSMELETRSLE